MTDRDREAEGQLRPYAPPPFWAPMIGRLMLAVVKAPLAVIMTWTVTRLLGMTSSHLLDLIAVSAVATVAAISVGIIAERPFIIQGESTAPGGWGFAIVPWAAYSVAALAVAVTGLGVADGLALGFAMSIVQAVQSAYLKEWVVGHTDDEERQKWHDFKEMTKETFAPDVAEIQKRLEDRAMDGYRQKIADRAAERRDQTDERPGA